MYSIEIGFKIIMKSYRMNQSNILILIAIVLNLLMFVDLRLFNVLWKWCPYINLIFMAWWGLHENFRRMREGKFLFLCCLFSYLFLASLLNKSSLGALCAFLTIFSVVLFFSKQPFSPLFFKGLSGISLCILCWYFIHAKSYYSLFKADESHAMNPNSIGMITFILYAWLNTYLSRDNVKSKKIAKLCLFFACIYIELSLKCRSSLIILIFYTLLFWFMPKKFWTSKIRVSLLTITIFLGGFIFPLYYVRLSKNIDLSIWIYNLTGKYLFTGRELIWGRFFKILAQDWLSIWVGPGSNMEYAVGQGFSLHNSYLGITLNYGILGFTFLASFIIYKIYHLCSKEISNSQISLLIAYLSILILSYSEVVLQTTYITVLVNMLLGLFNNPSFHK